MNKEETFEQLPSSKKEAKQIGSAKYFSGKTCANGHIVPRSTITDRCDQCAKEKSRRGYDKDPQAAKNRASVWASENSERKKRSSRLRDAFQKYGLSEADLKTLIEKQNNCCACCKRPFVDTPRIDHDHVTGKVRGLLCVPCNTGLGMIKDNVNTLRNMIPYLKKGE